VKEIQVTAS